jgi:putative ABC transport system permease protein
VLDDWQPQPKFYDLNNGSFDAPEDVYIPWKWGETLKLGSYGNSNCWKIDNIDSFEGFASSECVWVQAWVELPTIAARYRMQSMLDAFTDRERKAGRFPRPRNNRLTDVEQWLKDQRVVQSDNRVLVVSPHSSPCASSTPSGCCWRSSSMVPPFPACAARWAPAAGISSRSTWLR